MANTRKPNSELRRSRRLNNSSASSASANPDTSATQSRQRTRSTRMSTRVYGYQRAAPARNSTVFLPFSYGQGDQVSVPVHHYLEVAIDPPIIEIVESDTNEETTNPPSYAELFPNLSTYPRPPTQPSPPTQPNPPKQQDRRNHLIASSSRVPAEFTVTTLVQSSSRSTGSVNDGKERATDFQPMAIYSSPLNSGFRKQKIRQNSNAEDYNNSKKARFDPVNKSNEFYNTHLVVASSCAFYTPYEYSKKIKAIELLTGTRVDPNYSFD
ncbi:hypothetical protein AYI69_g4956 [Smittium culicis]|uniref:Uncharacterized protein n=1 Tax=Smittium culicis TaxID=133412 RepID=A0A1R1Y9H5_9FUNG|nr:hypothetical protein AYI69_g4956 [Smittium culicis]